MIANHSKMMRMNTFLVLIACFTHIYAYVDPEDLCLLEDSNKKCCTVALTKLQRFLDVSGMITFSKHKFVFVPTQDWIVFAKQIIQSGESKTLQDMDPKEVDEIFKNNFEGLTPMTVMAIKAQVSGPNLLNDNGLDWKFTGAEGSGNPEGIIRLGKGSSPILESKKGEMRFEFNIGPQFWQSERASPDICAEFGISRGCMVKLGEPSLEVEKKAGFQRLTFLIMVYHAELNGKSIAIGNGRNNRGEARMLQLARGIGEVLVGRIQNMKTEEHIGLPYQYSFTQEAIHMQDANSILYALRWIKPQDCSHIMVNLYELMRQYLKNPHVTYIYPDVPPSPQDFKAADSAHRILFVDKFLHSDDLSGYKGNYVPKPKPDGQMMRMLQERLNTISQKVENEDLNEKTAPQWKNWIIDLIKSDFRKFRQGRDLEWQFLPGDTHFAGREEIEYRPSNRKFGPQYNTQGFQKTPYNLEGLLQSPPYVEDSSSSEEDYGYQFEPPPQVLSPSLPPLPPPLPPLPPSGDDCYYAEAEYFEDSSSEEDYGYQFEPPPPVLSPSLPPLPPSGDDCYYEEAQYVEDSSSEEDYGYQFEPPPPVLSPSLPPLPPPLPPLPPSGDDCYYAEAEYFEDSSSSEEDYGYQFEPPTPVLSPSLPPLPPPLPPLPPSGDDCYYEEAECFEDSSEEDYGYTK